MSKQRYDIIYDQNGVHLGYHFCRSWDEDHGYSLEDAADEMVRYYQNLADEWKARTSYDYLRFKEKENEDY